MFVAGCIERPLSRKLISKLFGIKDNSFMSSLSTLDLSKTSKKLARLKLVLIVCRLSCIDETETFDQSGTYRGMQSILVNDPIR